MGSLIGCADQPHPRQPSEYPCRFSSPEQALGTGSDLIPVQETLLYVELNPVRVKLTSLPEQWKAGSAYLRNMGEDDFLIPMEQIFPHLAKKKVYGYYRALQLHRGLNPTRENQASIPVEILRAELKRGFTAGLYRERCRGFIDGIMLGSEGDMRRELDRMVLEGVFSRRWPCPCIKENRGPGSLTARTPLRPLS